jgi:hypothetical protein
MGVLEGSMFWQFLGEHPGELPNTFVATKDPTVYEDNYVFSDIAP